MAFYVHSPGFQPKRKFRFVVEFGNFQSETTYMVTKCGKPSFELTGPTEHRVLNHTFKFPGIVKWSDIDMTLIDAIDPNVGSKFYNALRNMGYVQPDNLDNLHSGITKVSAQASLGTIRIIQLDAGATDISGFTDLGAPAATEPSHVRQYEEWILKNAYLKSVKWGDLDYNTEDIMTVDVGIVYDYAVYVDEGTSGRPYKIEG